MICSDHPPERHSLTLYYLIMPDESIIEKDILLLPITAKKLNQEYRDKGSYRRLVSIDDIRKMQSGHFLFTCTS